MDLLHVVLDPCSDAAHELVIIFTRAGVEEAGGIHDSHLVVDPRGWISDDEGLAAWGERARHHPPSLLEEPLLLAEHIAQVTLTDLTLPKHENRPLAHPPALLRGGDGGHRGGGLGGGHVRWIPAAGLAVVGPPGLRVLHGV